MTRARFCLGDDTLRQRFDAIREAVICAPREPKALMKEIITMRERLRAAHPTKEGRFDVKHSAGGMIDAEFVMQYLVLSQAASHPEMRVNAGNIALLERAESAGLLPEGVGHAAATAYRELRRVQHRARLNEEPTFVLLPQLQEQREAVLMLWQTVFGAAAGTPPPE